jgi:hypothetical protein
VVDRLARQLHGAGPYRRGRRTAGSTLYVGAVAGCNSCAVLALEKLRVFGRGDVFAEDGTMLASITQENLMRPVPPSA